MTRLRPAALLLLAALPGAAWAACNPTGTQICCERHEEEICTEVVWATADHADPVSIDCNIASFSLFGIAPGYDVISNHVWWVPVDSETVCPIDEGYLQVREFPYDVTWVVADTEGHEVSGSGTTAYSTPEMKGFLLCNFKVASQSPCHGQHEEWYGCWTNLPPVINSLAASSAVSYDGGKSFPVTTDTGIPDPLPADSLVIPRYKVTDEKDSTVSQYVVELVANPNTAEMETMVGDAEWAFLKGPASGNLVYESPLVSQVDTPCVGGHYIYKWHSCDTYPWGKAGVLLPLGGPDVTEYLISEFNRYQSWFYDLRSRVRSDDGSLKTIRGFILGTALYKTGDAMNHKTQTIVVGESPYRPLCKDTVTISGHVFGKDQIGNFLYAYVCGLANLTEELTEFFGRFAAARAGTIENPDDVAAYEAGFKFGQSPLSDWKTILDSCNVRAMQNSAARIGWPSSDTFTGRTYPVWTLPEKE